MKIKKTKHDDDLGLAEYLEAMAILAFGTATPWLAAAIGSSVPRRRGFFFIRISLKKRRIVIFMMRFYGASEPSFRYAAALFWGAAVI